MIAGVAGSLCYLHWTLTSYSLTWQQALPFCILSLSTAIHMPFSVSCSPPARPPQLATPGAVRCVCCFA
jgi:hypothetical protein